MGAVWEYSAGAIRRGVPMVQAAAGWRRADRTTARTAADTIVRADTVVRRADTIARAADTIA
ncbi:MAG: hypothetical protein SGI73_15300, partial [Chloroflexota bacterium]|nr:hypothetical protein [Chloroflexota bacterium]